ncbi:flagellar type III secretion system pore protein FliP, partial [Campylobacter jejuni]
MKKILLFLLLSMSLFAAEATIPTVNLSLSAPNTPNQLVTTLNIVIVLTILALAPSIVFVMTSFLRLIVVFSFLRQAMGTQSMPPNTILVTLALILTFFIMEPVATKSYNEGIKPYLAEKIGYEEAFIKGAKPF